MKSLYVAILFAFLCVPIQAQTTTLVPNEDGIYVKQTLNGPQETRQETRQETKGADGFRLELGKAVRRAVRKGELTRTKAMRIRVAMITPAFRKHAEDLAITQMAFSSSADVLPFDDNGKVQRTAIDWQGFADFLERIIPLILQLIELFGA